MSATNPYPPSSRYHGLPALEPTQPDGRVVAHLPRRIVTDPDRLLTRAVHEVEDGERLDSIAADRHGDPCAWWLLAEAEVVDHPADLVADPGRRIRVVLPPAGQEGAAG